MTVDFLRKKAVKMLTPQTANKLLGRDENASVVLTPPEAAGIIGVTSHTVSNHAKSGKLRASKRGGTLRIPVTALAEYLNMVPAESNECDCPSGRWCG